MDCSARIARSLGYRNGGSAPVFSTHGKAVCLTSITTYHWDDGNGAPPGELGLTAESGLLGGPGGLGPWHVSATSGQDNAPEVNWRANVSLNPPVILDGRYACSDSDPSTWSSNSSSGGDGFCTVQAEPAIYAQSSG